MFVLHAEMAGQLNLLKQDDEESPSENGTTLHSRMTSGPVLEPFGGILGPLPSRNLAGSDWPQRMRSDLAAPLAVGVRSEAASRVFRCIVML